MKFLTSLSLYLLPLLTASTVKAWGTLGHTTVAYIATGLVSPHTKAYFQSLLYNHTDEYMANVATWADSFRYTAAGKFSGPLHYVDAQDNVPDGCGIQMSRDCGVEGCIVGAVANYTAQLLDPKTPWKQRNMAAKFIIHFLGDIHQPLHTESLLRGGNSIHVLFTSRPTNLHHLWDTSIPEHLIGGYSRFHASKWAANLTSRILTGDFKSETSKWIEGMSLTDAAGSALIWASEANEFICSTVLPEGLEGVEDKELSGAYYEDAVPVVETLVARAGYRLAKWLDLIVAVSREREL